MFFPQINLLKELVKTYYITSVYDAVAAQKTLDEINKLRLAIALDAEQRQIYVEQLNVPLNASGYGQDFYFAKNDIRYTIRRAIASLETNARISLEQQSGRNKVITREQTTWQTIFADIQRESAWRGEQTPFEFDEEIRLNVNESLNVNVVNQIGEAGYIFFHGATLRDEDLTVAARELKSEFIAENGQTKYLPETQLVPIVYKFSSGDANTLAVNPNGGDDILSIRNDKTFIATHIGTTASNSRITITDEAKNLLICDTVEMRGVAANYTNPFNAFYPLPYPHLLRKGSRFKIKSYNGSILTGDEMAANDLQYLVFKGITL